MKYCLESFVSASKPAKLLCAQTHQSPMTNCPKVCGKMVFLFRSLLALSEFNPSGGPTAVSLHFNQTARPTTSRQASHPDMYLCTTMTSSKSHSPFRCNNPFLFPRAMQCNSAHTNMFVHNGQTPRNLVAVSPIGALTTTVVQQQF